MKSKSLIWIVAGVLLLCLGIAPVTAFCTLTADSGSVMLGGGVNFHGTCNASETVVYLSLTGPNMPAAGANMQEYDLPNSPVQNGNASTFLWVPVVGGNWNRWWGTQGHVLEPGNYTVYGQTAPVSPPSGGSATYSLTMTRNPSNGELKVNTVPTGADVYLIGSFTGYETNCQIHDWIPGTLSLMVFKPGYYGQMSNVSIVAGTTATVTYTLVPIPAPGPYIDIAVAGDYRYYFGEQLKFSGKNTATTTTYLYITGPGLPVGGAQLNGDPKNSPVEDGNASSFTHANVSGGNWTYRWTPYERPHLDVGTYNIYAVTTPTNNLTNATHYHAVSIILQRPFISSSASRATGPPGTVFFIRGTREGGRSPDYYANIFVTNNTPSHPGSLPENGVKPDDFSIESMSGDNSTFGEAWVNTDATFNYTWDTSSISGGSILPGSPYLFVVGMYPLNFTDARADPDGVYTKLQIGIEGPVTADYIVDTSSGTAPLTVNFTDNSAGIPTSLALSFGDGMWDNTTSWRYTHTYNSAGNYTPVLYAWNSVSSDSGTNATITVTGPRITVTSPNGGESWDLGSTHNITWTSSNVPGTSMDISAIKDGTTNIPITYGVEIGSGSYVWTIPQDWVAGNQYVIKVTSSSNLAISDVSDGYFTIAAPIPVLPVADFTADKLNEVAPLNVQFTDRSTGLPDARSWDFGDGSTSTVKDPYHTFYGAGQSYTVSLTVTKGLDSSTKTMAITVPAAAAPAADFKYVAANGVIVQFTDMSTGGTHTVSWDFGDGSTSTDLNPEHTFDLGTDKTRTYWVKLTATYSGIPYSVTKQVAVTAITQGDAFAQVPSTRFEINRISQVAKPAGQLVFGGGQSSITIPKPSWVVAKLPYHRNGDGPTQICLVTSDSEDPICHESQSLPLNGDIGGEDPYGMTKTPYGGANGVVSAETSQTTGGLGPLNLLSKVSPLDSQSNNYALLIDGGKNANENHIRYWNDISFMYQTLTKVYGYKKANIIVLMTDGGAAGADRHYATENGAIKTDSSSSDFDGDGSAEAVGIASKANLISTLYNLNASKTSSDHLFIFTTGHGGQISGESVKYYLWNGDEITDAEFVNALPDKFGDITLVMEQCNGGGFINDFSTRFHTGYDGQKRIIHTAASASESSYGNAFSNVWTRSVAMVTDRVQPTTEADTNTPDVYDGKINMQEAFTFARNTDPAATGELSPFLETPQESYTNDPQPRTKFLASSGWAVPNTIIVAVPNIVETWYAGFDRPIAWTSRGVTNVKIQLYNSTSPGTYYDLKTTTAAAAGKWTWYGTDTSNKNAGNAALRTYKIKITDTAASGTNDMSDQYFYIKRGGTAGPLSVNSNVAGAKIYLDGVDTLLTTIVGKKQISASASPGTHTIALTGPTRYLDQERMITKLSSSAEQIENFWLLEIDSNTNYREDDAGSMVITATPPEARIFINDVDQGTTLFKQKVIPGIDWEDYPKKYDVKVMCNGDCNGYLPASGFVEVARGQTAYADFVLKGDPTWYTFTGFDAPVDMPTEANPDVVNIATAGRNIPLKWHLSDGKGIVSNSEHFNLILVSSTCGAVVNYDELEEYDPATTTPGLKYQGNGEWHYNWKTVKNPSFIGKCYNVYLVFKNGVTSPVAQFRFK